MKNIAFYLFFFCIIHASIFAQSADDNIDEISEIPDSSFTIPSFTLDPILALPWKSTKNKIEKTTIENNVGNDATRLLQSKITGLNIFANSYTPGASSRMIFRGYRSANNSNQPLILLNGIPLDNSEFLNSTYGPDQSNRLIDIDPKLIESVDFIGSAAGRAKYGIVGANGVLLVQTKNSYQKKLNISYSTTLLKNQVSNLLLLQNSRAQGRIIEGDERYLGPETSNGFSWGPEISELSYDGSTDYPYDKNGRLVFDGSGPDANAYDPYDFFTNTWTQNHTMRLSKGTEKLSANIMGSYTNELGVIPTNEFTRYNGSIGLHYTPTRRLAIHANGIINSSSTSRNRKGADLSGIMLGLMRNSPTFDITNGLEDPLNNSTSYELDNGSPRSFRPSIYDNPYWSLNKNSNKGTVNRQLVQLGAKYEVNDKLSVLFNGGIDRYADIRKGGNDIIPPVFLTRYGYAYENEFIYDASNIGISSQYKLVSSDQMKVDFTLGYEFNQSGLSIDLLDGRPLVISGDVSIANAETLTKTSFFEDLKRAGGFFAVDFAYGYNLDLTASIRQDYSNQFGNETNGFTSYGLGAEYKLASLKKLDTDKSIDIILKGSVGRFGNNAVNSVNLGPFITPSITGDGFISSFPENGLEPNDIGISNSLTAESTLAFDAGVLFNIWDKLYFDISYYSENSTGLSMIQPISSTSGLNFQYTNVGSITNNGLDITLSANPIQSKFLNWSFDVRFNNNKNVVNAINGVDSVLTMGPFVSTNSSLNIGNSYGVLMGSAFRRNENGELIIDEEGWPLSDPTQQILGDPNPDWMMFIGNEITLAKNVFISALIEIKRGGDLYCGTCGVTDYFGRSQKAISEIDAIVTFDGVTETGEQNNVAVELAPTSGTDNFFYRVRYGFGGLTEMNVYDASWVKLRNLSIGYDFSSLIGLKTIQSMKLSFVMENFILNTTYPNIDPETNLTGNNGVIGIDYYNNPGIQRYGLKLDLNF